MKLLFDFFPVLLFFVAFKLFGIYVATAVAMATTFGAPLLESMIVAFRTIHRLGDRARQPLAQD